MPSYNLSKASRDADLETVGHQSGQVFSKKFLDLVLVLLRVLLIVLLTLLLVVVMLLLLLWLFPRALSPKTLKP